MQKYSTIIGVIELRSQKIGYATTQRRYRIGSSTVTLIMKRFRELGKTLEELKAMDPKEVVNIPVRWNRLSGGLETVSPDI